MPLARCPRCRRRNPLVVRAAAAGEYEGALRAVVHALKYEGRRSLAAPLAELMRARSRDVLDRADALVPVPLHASRRRARGFNQAMDLARRLGSGGLPVCAALRRVRPTAAQTGLPAVQRRRNVRGAFAPARPFWTVSRDGRRAAFGQLRGATAVLVDDVSTTGATLEACAAVLIAMGVREVRAITAARVVTPPR